MTPDDPLFTFSPEFPFLHEDPSQLPETTDFDLVTQLLTTPELPVLSPEALPPLSLDLELNPADVPQDPLHPATQPKPAPQLLPLPAPIWPPSISAPESPSGQLLPTHSAPSFSHQQTHNAPPTPTWGESAAPPTPSRSAQTCSTALPEESALLPGMQPQSTMAQLALNRIPSGASSSSNQEGSELPSTRPSGKEGGTQSKMRYSEGATASNYCHVCGRASNTIELAACANTRIGLCRKVMCDKCLLLHQRPMFYYAKEANSSWICMHCRNMCPKRARCHQYQKNNLRRRLRNEQKAKIPKENKPKTPRKVKKQAAKSPVGLKKTPVAKGRVEKKAPSHGAVAVVRDEPVSTTPTPPVVTSIQTAQSENFHPIYMTDSNGMCLAGSGALQSSNARTTNIYQPTVSASRNVIIPHHNLSNHVAFASGSQRPAPLQNLSASNDPSTFSVSAKMHLPSANGVSPTGIASVTFANGTVTQRSFGSSEALGQGNC